MAIALAIHSNTTCARVRCQLATAIPIIGIIACRRAQATKSLATANALIPTQQTVFVAQKAAVLATTQTPTTSKASSVNPTKVANLQNVKRRNAIPVNTITATIAKTTPSGTADRTITTAKLSADGSRELASMACALPNRATALFC